MSKYMQRARTLVAVPAVLALVALAACSGEKKNDTLAQDSTLNRDMQLANADTAAKPALDELVSVLRDAGIPNRAIDIEFTDPYESGSPDRAIVVFAGEMQCHTIVIGHDSHSWFREMTGGHLAEHLLRHTKATAVWVVQ